MYPHHRIADVRSIRADCNQTDHQDEDYARSMLLLYLLQLQGKNWSVSRYKRFQLGNVGIYCLKLITPVEKSLGNFLLLCGQYLGIIEQHSVIYHFTMQ